MNAIALSGAVINEVNGSRMSYYQKCNRCGNVPNSTISTSTPSSGNIMTSTYWCPTCRCSTNVQIKGI